MGDEWGYNYDGGDWGDGGCAGHHIIFWGWGRGWGAKGMSKKFKECDCGWYFLAPKMLLDEGRFHAKNRGVTFSAYLRFAIANQNRVDAGMTMEEVRMWKRQWKVEQKIKKDNEWVMRDDLKEKRAKREEAVEYLEKMKVEEQLNASGNGEIPMLMENVTVEEAKKFPLLSGRKWGALYGTMFKEASVPINSETRIAQIDRAYILEGDTACIVKKYVWMEGGKKMRCRFAYSKETNVFYLREYIHESNNEDDIVNIGKEVQHANEETTQEGKRREEVGGQGGGVEGGEGTPAVVFSYNEQQEVADAEDKTAGDVKGDDNEGGSEGGEGGHEGSDEERRVTENGGEDEAA